MRHEPEVRRGFIGEVRMRRVGGVAGEGPGVIFGEVVDHEGEDGVGDGFWRGDQGAVERVEGGVAVLLDCGE